MTDTGRCGEFQGSRVAFVATRVAGKDGVSLEIEKWADVLQRLGIECFYIAGECDRPPQQTRLIELAHFSHPTILEMTQQAFEPGPRGPSLTDGLLKTAREIRQELNQAIADFRIDAIIAQNALTIPMNIPLGLAIVQSIQELGVGCIAHHHDFYWERQRYLIGAVDDLLRYAFPPALPQIQHVVINSVAAEEFSRRTGLSCRVIANVMDFANPPQPPDDYAASVRDALGMAEGERLVLQPTRIVARKGIEHSVELVRRMAAPCRLVVPHAAGDEGNAYGNFLDLLSDVLRVRVDLADKWVADQRAVTEDGGRIYTLDDVYQQADLVAYPSEYEGFGNAFLEAVYFRRPIVCKRYPIFRRDIEPCGFRTIAFDGFITGKLVQDVDRLLADPERVAEMVEHNYRVARKHFSYEVLEDELRPLLRRVLTGCPHQR